MPTSVSLVQYPIKGMRGLLLPRVILKAGQGFPLDRAYAIENGGRKFDSQNPKWLPKTSFLQLMQHERLARLSLSFNEAGNVLILFRDGQQVAKGALET